MGRRADGERSLGDLLSDLMQKTRALVRREIALAKTELRESAARAGGGLLFPGTRREDELMGQTRDRAMHQAKDYAREAGERVATEAAKEGDGQRRRRTRKRARQGRALLWPELSACVRTVG